VFVFLLLEMGTTLPRLFSATKETLLKVRGI